MVDTHTWEDIKRKRNNCDVYEYQYNSIEIKPNLIPTCLIKFGFELVRIIEEDFQAEYKKPIYFYQLMEEYHSD